MRKEEDPVSEEMSANASFRPTLLQNPKVHRLAGQKRMELMAPARAILIRPKFSAQNCSPTHLTNLSEVS